jgi:hypothetical protein
MDKDVTRQITEVIDTLRHAEAQATQMLQAAREQRLSFGLSCNYINDDIAQTLGKLRYMLRLAERANDERPAEATRYDPRVIGAQERHERSAALRNQEPQRSAREDRNVN